MCFGVGGCVAYASFGETLMLKVLDIHLGGSYSIFIGTEVFEKQLLPYCQRLQQRLVMITDSNLEPSWALHLQNLLQSQGLSVLLLSFPAGEQYKTRETKAYLEDALLKHGYGRDTCLIAVGGGVVCDVVGFLTSTYCRGIPGVYVPTTLLAMVDASIGGKTAVDTPYGKNLIGSFYQPSAVFMDVRVLETLPEHEWRQGMVEMLKHGLIADVVYFETLRDQVQKFKARDLEFLLEVIYQSCVIKKNVVELDEREQGLRQVLNFGHTFGHALEVLSNYQLAHGDAVAIGMVLEAYVSMLCGFLSLAQVERIIEVLREFGLSLRADVLFDSDQVLSVLSLDKKAKNSVPRFVLLDDLGCVHVEDDQYSMAVDEQLLRQALDFLETQC